MYLAFTTQVDLLPVLMQVGLLIFFPIGILLRAIPFVRGIGGTLIAIGIALSLIYPTVLVAFNAPVSSAIGSFVPSSGCTINLPVIGTFICSLANALTSALPLGFLGSQGTTGLWDGIGSLTSIYPAFNGIQYYSFVLTLQFVLLLLDVVIVVTIAQNIAKILGGSIRLGIGGRLKLA